MCGRFPRTCPARKRRLRKVPAGRVGPAGIPRAVDGVREAECRPGRRAPCPTTMERWRSGCGTTVSILQSRRLTSGVAVFTEATMGRKFIDCRAFPSEMNCSISIIADTQAALLH